MHANEHFNGNLQIFRDEIPEQISTEQPGATDLNLSALNSAVSDNLTILNADFFCTEENGFSALFTNFR